MEGETDEQISKKIIVTGVTALAADIYAHLDYHAQTQTGNVMGSMYEK